MADSSQLLAYKDREVENENSLGDVFNANANANASPSKVKSKLPEVFRRPFMPFGAVVRGSEESTDGDAWIDTDVDADADDDVSVVSERAVVLNSPERDVFGQLS